MSADYDYTRNRDGNRNCNRNADGWRNGRITSDLLYGGTVAMTNANHSKRQMIFF